MGIESKFIWMDGKLVPFEQANVHVLPQIKMSSIPKGWKIDRAFDWGSSRPFSVGWFAESNGEPMVVEGRRIGAVRGDVILVEEWYGWNGSRNEGSRMLASEVAQGIRDREDDWGVRKRVRAGPADTSIWDVENGVSIVKDFTRKGISWGGADKSAGSRKHGWELMRGMLRGAVPPREGPRETPGFLLTRSCQQWLETVPSITRSERDPDDVDTDAEDHAADMTRYRLRGGKTQAVRVGKM